MRMLALSIASLLLILTALPVESEASGYCVTGRKSKIYYEPVPSYGRKKQCDWSADFELYLGANYYYIWPCQCRPSFSGGSISDGQVEANNISTGGIDATLFFTPEWAFEFSAWGGKHRFRGLGTDLAGNNVGETWFISSNYIAQYHFPMCDCFPDIDFFAGFGLNLTWFIAESTDLVGTSITLDRTSIGALGQVGVNYKIDRCWMASFDAKIIQMGTDITLSGTTSGQTHLSLNPWVFGVGLKRIF